MKLRHIFSGQSKEPETPHIELAPDGKPVDPWHQFTYSSRRIRLKPLLIIIVVVAVLAAGIAVGASLFSARIEGASPDLSPAQMMDPATYMMPQAELGTGVTITLEEHSGQPLTPQEIYRACIPSVVYIQTSVGLSGYAGTGIIMTDDGYIITNHHVIEDAYRAIVTLADGTLYEASLVGSSEREDLAVLKIDAVGLTPAVFGNSDQLEVGERVLAIGNPLQKDFQGTLTDGILSAVNRQLWIDGRRLTVLQSTATLNPGNSGGPLLNMYGQVIGVNVAKISGPEAGVYVESMNFSIPSTVVKTTVDSLIETGSVSASPVLGVEVYAVSNQEAVFYDMEAGIYVMTVDQRADAWSAGLRPGDIITAVNGDAVDALDDISKIESTAKPGDPVTLSVLREGTVLELEVLLLDPEELP